MSESLAFLACPCLTVQQFSFSSSPVTWISLKIAFFEDCFFKREIISNSFTCINYLSTVVTKLLCIVCCIICFITFQYPWRRWFAWRYASFAVCMLQLLFFVGAEGASPLLLRMIFGYHGQGVCVS